MKYAIAAGAWLMAWGALAPQSACAGFVLSVDQGMSAAASSQATDRNADSSPDRPSAPKFDSVFDSLLGVLEIPSGTRAPSNSPTSQSSAQPCLLLTAVRDPVDQVVISSHLSLDQMFSLKTMYKSSVFRPPRA